MDRGIERGRDTGRVRRRNRESEREREGERERGLGRVIYTEEKMRWGWGGEILEKYA